MAADGTDRREDETFEESSTSIVREEARYVLDGQLRILRETDRKAMVTARVVAGPWAPSRLRRSQTRLPST